jgi:hypothetical protein
MKKIFVLLAALTMGNAANAQNVDSIMVMLKGMFTTNKHYIEYKQDTNNLFFYYYNDSLGKEHRITEAVFEDANNFVEDLAVVKLNGKFGFIDTLGAMAIPCIYDNASAFSEGKSIVFYNCKTGILDKNGVAQLLDKDYEYVYPFNEGRSIVVFKNRYGVINKQGVEVVPTVYKSIEPFSLNRAIVIDTITGLAGAIDTTGSLVIPPTYLNMSAFNSYNISLVTNNFINEKKDTLLKMGACDMFGKIIVPVLYDYVSPIYNEAYELVQNGSPFMLLAENEKVPKSKAYNFNNYSRRKFKRFNSGRRNKKYKDLLIDNAVYASNGKRLYYDNKNRITALDGQHAFTLTRKEINLINIEGAVKTIKGVTLDSKNKYRAVGNNAITIKNKKGLLGLIDFDGNTLIKPEYNKILSFNDMNFYESQTYTMAYKKDTILVMDKDYKIVTRLNADNIIRETKEYRATPAADSTFNLESILLGLFAEHTIYIISHNKKQGILDSAFNVLLPPVYDELVYDSDRIIFAQNKKYGIMDDKYKVLLPATYDRLKSNRYSDPSAYRMYTVQQNKKTGFCDINGNLMLKPEYDMAYVEYQTSYWEKDTSRAKIRFVVGNNKKYGVLDHTAQPVIPVMYDDVRLYNNEAIVKSGKKYALFNKNGKDLTGFVYNNLTNYRNDNYIYGYYFAENKKKVGLVDTLGTLAIPIVYDAVNYVTAGFVVKQDKKYGLVNTANKVLIPIIHDYLYNSYENDNLKVVDDGKTGLADINGNMILPVEYDGVESWKDDLYLISKGNDTSPMGFASAKYGVANNKGKVIIPADYGYSQIDYYRNTIILTTPDKKYFYNSQGDPVNDCYIEKHIGWE